MANSCKPTQSWVSFGKARRRVVTRPSPISALSKVRQVPGDVVMLSLCSLDPEALPALEQQSQK